MAEQEDLKSITSPQSRIEDDYERFDDLVSSGDQQFFGQPLARRLVWLESAVSKRGRYKFEHGKVGYPPFGGQYVQGIIHTKAGRTLLAELINELKAGQSIHLCDVSSYYRAGKRWPLGMQIVEGELVDVWYPKVNRPGQTSFFAMLLPQRS